MSIIKLIFTRFVTLVVTLFIVSFLIFGITQILPGDVAFLILGRGATEEAIAAVRQDLGLHLPFYQQYTNWLGNILRGDLGQSLIMDRDIYPILKVRLIRSLYLALFSFIGVIIFGIGFGIISAIKRNSLLDKIITGFSYILISIPEFVSGTLLILIFAVGPLFNILPASGYGDISEGIWNWLQYMILPSLTLIFVILAYVLRMTRTNMLEVMKKDYVRTAHLKGLKKTKIIFKHILRNALIPTITLLGINLAWMIGGIVITEEVFDYPGLGRLTVFAINNRDIPLIQATVLTLSLFYMLGSFISDIFYLILNPKLRGE